MAASAPTSTFDFEATLATARARQWAIADIDWAAPGAELITDDQRARIKAFMADLVWIECVGARGFAALATVAPTPTIGELYRLFEREELRHAQAELALMQRWGMLAPGEVPEPNINVRLAIEWLDHHADGSPLIMLGTVIPMLEVALDGALLKFLCEDVRDPLCQQVFYKVNADESRHLAVGFAVMDLLGRSPRVRMIAETIAAFLSPKMLFGILAYLPLLNRMRDDVVAMGVSEHRLYQSIGRYRAAGRRSAAARRLPMFQIVVHHARMMVDRAHPYHLAADALVRATARVPRRWLRPLPRWATALAELPRSNAHG